VTCLIANRLQTGAAAAANQSGSRAFSMFQEHELPLNSLDLKSAILF